MSKNTTYCWMCVLSICLLFSLPFVCQAQEEADEQAAKEVKENPFAVPETEDAEELLQFILDLRANRPPRPRDPASYRAFTKYMRQAPKASREAAERILELKKDDLDSKVAKAAQGFLLESQIRSVMEADNAERKAIFEEVLAHLKGTGINRDNIGLAHGLATMLERVDPQLASKAYLAFGTLVAASKDEEISGLASHFEGPGRRLSMLGNKLEVLTGTTLDGKEFDWDSYRGKVVLIDFWATWCGPCVAELPNVLAAYEKYNDKGFEVVAISLDRSREPLEKFVAKKDLPWTQLYQDEGRNEMADYYGISAIPSVWLVDRDGKVISMQARGRELELQLAKIFGEASDSAEDSE